MSEPSNHEAQEVAPAERGRAAVEKRLTTATAELLAEVGPARLSIRAVSERARVNSGQVYHYFGSKNALLRAGMGHLAEQHHKYMRDAAAGNVEMSLRDDDRYWRALAHAVIDGAEDLFRIEIDERMSVPRDQIETKRAEAGGTLTPEQTTDVLATFALALGWVTFEPFLLALIDQDADRPSPEVLRASVAGMLQSRLESHPGSNH
jgi:AcrR family transcriptional regulator